MNLMERFGDVQWTKKTCKPGLKKGHEPELISAGRNGAPGQDTFLDGFFFFFFVNTFNTYW